MGHLMDSGDLNPVSFRVHKYGGSTFNWQVIPLFGMSRVQAFKEQLHEIERTLEQWTFELHEIQCCQQTDRHCK